MRLRALAWLADGILLALGGLLAFQILESFTGRPGSAAVAPPELPAAGAPPAPPDPQVIVERNPFAPLVAAAPAPAPEPEEELEQTELPLTLVGTVATGDPELSQAAVRNGQSGETLVVGVGDAVAPDATALRIERRRLILLEQGERRELTLRNMQEIREQVYKEAVRKQARAKRKRARMKELVEAYRGDGGGR